MVDLFEYPDEENQCDVCSETYESTINGNQLCERHLREYRNKHFY